MQPESTQRLEGGRRLQGESRAQPPLVSIVIVLFRAKEECLRLLNNISAFDHSQFELIIIDGGSGDGTLEILREWDDRIDYWLSEADSGIYDAMNKGIAAARGEYILHLNEGDTLKFIPREELAKCLAEKADVVSFAVETTDEIFRPILSSVLRIVNTWHHQGTFYRRTPDLVYDASYGVYADFDLNQRFLKKGKRVRIFDKIVVSYHQTGGVSCDRRVKHEVYRVIFKNFGGPYVILGFLWPYYQALRRVTKRALVYLLSLIGKSWPERS